MRLVVLVLLVAAARFFITAIGYPPIDGDLAWQHWLGNSILVHHALPTRLGAETFTAAGAPWIPQEWAFSTILALALRAHLYWLFAAAIAGCALLTLVLVALRAHRAGASNTAIALCALFTAIALFESFAVRVQTVAWLCLTLFLYTAELPGKKRWYAILVAVIWANLHASVMLAPAIAGILVFFRRPVGRSDLAFFGACVVATCCSPLTWHLPVYAVALLESPIRHAINEWRPTQLTDGSFAFGLLPLVLCIALTGTVGLKRRWDLAVLFVVFLLLALSSARNIAVCAIVIAPVAALAMTELIAAWKSPATRRDATGEWIVTIASSFAAGVVIAVLLVNRPQAGQRFPVQSAAFVDARAHSTRLLCEDFAWCSAFLGHANVRTFLDGRADPFPVSVWRDYLRVINLQQWSATLTKWKVNTVLAHQGSALSTALDGSPHWRRSFSDGNFAVYDYVEAVSRCGTCTTLSSISTSRWNRGSMFLATQR